MRSTVREFMARRLSSIREVTIVEDETSRFLELDGDTSKSMLLTKAPITSRAY